MEASNAPTPSREWMTPKEAADYLRLPSVEALYQRHARGQVKAYRLADGRAMRFRRRDLDALMRPAHGAEQRAHVESPAVCAVAGR
jgi:excisionase family DNA binding protein